MTQQQSRVLTTSTRPLATPARSRSYRCRLNGLPVRGPLPAPHVKTSGRKKTTKDSLSLVSLLERGSAASTFCLVFQASGRAEVTAGNSRVCFTASAAGPDSGERRGGVFARK